MLNIDSRPPRIRFQMQPATATQSAAASRGGSFAKKLSQLRDSGNQPQHSDQSTQKLKMRKPHLKMEDPTDADGTVGPMVPQRPGASFASPAPPASAIPESFGLQP